MRQLQLWLVMTAVGALAMTALAAGGALPGVVCNVKVLSDKVPDVSSVEAWKKSFIDDKASNQDKAIALWRSVITFQYQDAPPSEFLQHEDLVYDPIKMLNVYGYAMCSPHSAHMEALGRFLGFKARGWAVNHHSINEFFYDNAWHHFDSSLMCYFLKDDGTVPGIEELTAAVKEFYAAHPDIDKADAAGRDKLLRAFEMADGRTGWKKGPKLIASSPSLNAKGWWPAGTHGWYATMQCFDGTAGPKQKAYNYEYCASMGYQVNLQLRKGERITRNWSNEAQHINMEVDATGKIAMDAKTGKPKTPPGCMEDKDGFFKNNQAFCDKLDPKHPNLTNGRVGNGKIEYDVPLADGSFRAAALTADNLASKSEGAAMTLTAKDASKPGVLVIRMPSSYVYLGGAVTAKAMVGEGGSVDVELSDNNGLDWKKVEAISASGDKTIDLRKFIMRRYDYRLRLTLNGKGTGLDGLKIANDIQHSQRPLPALDAGDNAITFSAGSQESTITAEANNKADHGDKQVTYKDFHPTIESLNETLTVKGKEGSLTVPIATPGEMTRVRACACFRGWSDDDTWQVQVSFDGGKTFKKACDPVGQQCGRQFYVTVGDVPAGTKQALVKFVGQNKSGNILGSFRVDADYKDASLGFAPVKVTYVWEENGVEKKDEHVAKQATEAYTIKCAAKPKMKSIILERAD